MGLSKINSQSGQGFVEFVLLLVLGVGIFLGLSQALKKSDFLNGITTKPWDVVSGMIECGAWKPCGVSKPGTKLHPSNRVISQRPEGQ